MATLRMVFQTTTLSSRRISWFDCAALLLLACLVRLFWLDQAPLWSDELFSVFWAQQDLGFLLGEGARIETNPPGYYVLLHLLIPSIGISAEAVRAVSVVFSAATVLVTYAIGRSLLGRPAALLAGAFAAIEPSFVQFAQAARPYALLGLMDGLALLALARIARRPSPALRGWWPWLALFVLSAIGAELAHYTAVFFIAACFAAIGLHLLTTRPFPVREALIWAGAALVIALAIAEPLLLARSLSHSPNIHWISPLSPRSLGGFFLDLLTYPGAARGVVSAGVAALMLLVAGVGLARVRPDPAQFGILLLIPAVFCVLLIGASVARPMLLSRVGVWMVIPLCLLLARGVLSFGMLRRQGAAALVTALVLLFGVRQYFVTYENEDWRSVVPLLAGRPGCGGPLLVSGDNSLGLAYYGAALTGRALLTFPLPDGDVTTAEFRMTDIVLHPAVLAADQVAPYVQVHPNAAVITRGVFLPEMPAPLQDLLQRAPFRATLGGGLVLSCFLPGG